MNLDTTLWSKWVMSVRKDVECVFGRLKGRFRTLKIPSRLHDISDVSMSFKAACVLYNWNLNSAAQNALELDDSDTKFNDDEVNVISNSHKMIISERARRELGIQSSIDADFDESGTGLYNTAVDLCEVEVEREDGWATLRSHLICHFKYAYYHGLCRWIGC
eukprot:m.26314 g.26314  ORF g.26314 m.26314 type:complete len:162 (+) comp13308_c0_seq1:844-1329(+)